MYSKKKIIHPFHGRYSPGTGNTESVTGICCKNNEPACYTKAKASM